MISKRLFLILGGTVGGLGAVVSITPPQFGSSGGLKTLGGKTTTPAPVAPAQTTAAVPTTPAQSVPTTPTQKKKPTNKPTTTPVAPAQTSAPSAPSAPQSTGASGTFTGNAAQTAYGPVQVQVTVSNGKITHVTVPVYPNNSGQDRYINSQAIPLLIQEVMQAQSANIQGVGGASYTSQGFYDSLITALKKAGI
jgi:uncharacterized protein with FMN-binding domain